MPIKKLQIYLILFPILIVFTYIASSGNLNHAGSDIVNPYRYYIALKHGADFYDFIKIYDGREYEVILPLVTYSISKVINATLSINEYSFILCIFVNFIILFTVIEILFKNKNISLKNKLISSSIFLLILDYGIIQQLIRQSMSIAVFMIFINSRQYFKRISLIILSILTHLSIIYTTIFYFLLKRNKSIIKAILYYFLPLFFIYLIAPNHPSLGDIATPPQIGNREILILIIAVFYIFFLSRRKLYISNIIYLFAFFYIANYIYYFLSSSGVFYRIFLINIIVINPLFISNMIGENKNALFTFFIVFILVIYNLILKTAQGHYFYNNPFIG